MQGQHLPGLNVTWVVPFSQVDAYKSAGALKVMTCGKSAPGKDLCRSRNFALEHAFDRKLVCVQLSDDLIKMSWWARAEPYPLELQPLSIETAIHIILKQMKLGNFHLGGGMPTSNTFWAQSSSKLGDRTKQLYTTHHFILGDFMVIRPTELRFNENLSSKEDYEYTVQHIKKYGGVVRCFQILAQWRHYTNEGGVVRYRTDEEEMKNIALLRELHPGWFAGHKTGSKVQVTLRAPAKYRRGSSIRKESEMSDGTTSASADSKASDTNSSVPVLVPMKKPCRRAATIRFSHSYIEDSGMGV
ncbi:hypothetical protein ONS95_002266 [Cadophora gregata]|uniref:uncharacterized protein n=1 Tax=Cadophora gregata TaxID=51156 RepID=UPI0026DAC59A|nr:uncharacterized protein ONS95_002266 [Cadophora gregata]KAK0109581.1 hypothetical protein ONS95_002266 [Cadophora gregata]